MCAEAADGEPVGVTAATEARDHSKLSHAAKGGGNRHLRDIGRILERQVSTIDDDLVQEFAVAREFLSAWVAVQRQR
jgi:hypothetical protein